MQVSIAYAGPNQQHWLNVTIADDATARNAIDASGILKLCPEIDLAQQRVGVYGKQVKLDAVLREGDRIEIYRPIICDPLTVPRRDGFGADDEE